MLPHSPYREIRTKPPLNSTLLKHNSPYLRIASITRNHRISAAPRNLRHPFYAFECMKVRRTVPESRCPVTWHVTLRARVAIPRGVSIDIFMSIRLDRASKGDHTEVSIISDRDERVAQSENEQDRGRR